MLFTPLFEWNTQSRLKRYAQIVRKILRQQNEYRHLDQNQLVAERLSLSLKARSGSRPAELILKTFSLVREATRRVYGIEHYDVQLLGGCAISEGQIAEMATGEGKTLTATLPLAVYSLYQRGAHLATANDYLASRDSEWVRPIYEVLGLTVGVVTQDSSYPERSRAYQSDITYGTLQEFAFDFLRGRLKQLSEDQANFNSYSDPDLSRIERPFYLLVDEADSLLIDEARTPLIISLPQEHPLYTQECFRWAEGLVGQFEENEDYQYDPQRRMLQLTPSGRKRLRNLLPADILKVLTLFDAEEAILRAIQAKTRFNPFEHYIVIDGEVRLIDQHTGRITTGRKLRQGLHQAIEAREQLELTKPQVTAGRITVKEFANRYLHLSGMTGTANEVSRELKSHYSCPVFPVSTNRPCRREVLPIQIFATTGEKYRFISNKILELIGQHRPVLIGTRTVQHSLSLSQHLQELGIEHTVLNGVQDLDEAEIICSAGQKANVTVATNMAGRGTDIELSESVGEAGGLHVIGTEFHESSRIDRQLAGRAARQGDPGSFQQLACFEDSLLAEAWGNDVAEQLLESVNQGFEHGYALRLFQRAQADLELRHQKERQLLFASEAQRIDLNRDLALDPWLNTLD